MKKLILIVIIGIVCLTGCTLSGLSFKVDEANTNKTTPLDREISVVPSG